MLSLMPYTPRYAIFYAIYPKLCYLLCHIPHSSAIFFWNVMLQYITLTPSYANSSYAMFSGQSRGHISGYCCMWISFEVQICSTNLAYVPNNAYSWTNESNIKFELDMSMLICTTYSVMDSMKYKKQGSKELSPRPLANAPKTFDSKKPL